MKKKLIFSSSILMLILTIHSCAYMAREVFASNRCQRCKIVNEYDEVVWSEDNCGGDVHNMTLKAKARAYDYGCNYKLTCEKYKRVK